MELRGYISMLSRATKLIMVLALVAGSLAIAAPAANAAPTYTVKAKSNDRWTGEGPQAITHAAKPGGKVIVKWKNPTNRHHDVKSLNTAKDWSMSRKTLQPGNGNVVKRTFKGKGRYYFRCTVHSDFVSGKWTGMVGQIHVFKPGR
jgi:plastocyanin